jgi:CheY-like chemotaxis protein
MMRDVLRHFGYDVEVTQSPEACVVLYDQARTGGRPFDLVVLDLTIRGGQRRGMDTLAALRIVDPAVRAVAHSGDPEAEIMKDPVRYGFVGAIRKPTPLAQLSRIVQSLIAKEA